jgi:hypothetical protein
VAQGKPQNYSDSRWYVNTREINDLAARLEGLSAGALETGFAEGNKAAVGLVAIRARQGAMGVGRQASAVANDPRAFQTRADKTSGAITLRGARAIGSTGKNDPTNFVFGSEFGANHNVARRVPVKSRTQQGQGRVKRKRGERKGEHDFGGFRTMSGWNQFPTWAGNRSTSVGEGIAPGYWLWPAVRDSQEDVATVYGQAAMTSLRAQLDHRG